MIIWYNYIYIIYTHIQFCQKEEKVYIYIQTQFYQKEEKKCMYASLMSQATWTPTGGGWLGAGDWGNSNGVSCTSVNVNVCCVEQPEPMDLAKTKDGNRIMSDFLAKLLLMDALEMSKPHQTGGTVCQSVGWPVRSASLVSRLHHRIKNMNMQFEKIMEPGLGMMLSASQCRANFRGAGGAFAPPLTPFLWDSLICPPWKLAFPIIWHCNMGVAPLDLYLSSLEDCCFVFAHSWAKS